MENIDDVHEQYMRESRALLEDLRALDRQSTARGAPAGLRSAIAAPMRDAFAKHTAIEAGAMVTTIETLASLLDDVRKVRAIIDAGVAAHAAELATQLIDGSRAAVVDAACRLAIERRLPLEDVVVALLDRCAPDIDPPQRSGPPIVFGHDRAAAAPMVRALSGPIADVLEASPAPAGSCFCVVFTYGRALLRALDVVPAPRGEA